MNATKVKVVNIRHSGPQRKMVMILVLMICRKRSDLSQKRSFPCQDVDLFANVHDACHTFSMVGFEPRSIARWAVPLSSLSCAMQIFARRNLQQAGAGMVSLEDATTQQQLHNPGNFCCPATSVQLRHWLLKAHKTHLDVWHWWRYFGCGIHVIGMHNARRWCLAAWWGLCKDWQAQLMQARRSKSSFKMSHFRVLCIFQEPFTFSQVPLKKIGGLPGRNAKTLLRASRHGS